MAIVQALEAQSGAALAVVPDRYGADIKDWVGPGQGKAKSQEGPGHHDPFGGDTGAAFADVEHRAGHQA